MYSLLLPNKHFLSRWGFWNLWFHFFSQFYFYLLRIVLQLLEFHNEMRFWLRFEFVPSKVSKVEGVQYPVPFWKSENCVRVLFPFLSSSPISGFSGRRGVPVQIARRTIWTGRAFIHVAQPVPVAKCPCNNIKKRVSIDHTRHWMQT